MAHTSDYPPFFVTCDLVVLSVRSGALCVLLVTRGGEPYAGRLALPGGFVQIDEGLEAAAYRELSEEAGIGRRDVILEQLATYGAPGRDPRSRVVSVAWLALGAAVREPRAGSDAAAARWVPVEEALRSRARLAFDHRTILRDGVERARAKLEYTGYAAALCGETFTVADLHAVYEAVWGVRLDRANFQRKVTGVEGFLTPTGDIREGGRGRPARVFRGDPGVTLAPPILRGDR
ncbi:MAG: NUDIX domain-containing protein [Ornithinibacter sp.]